MPLIWIVLIGVAAVGGVAFIATRKKPSDKHPSVPAKPKDHDPGAETFGSIGASASYTDRPRVWQAIQKASPAPEPVYVDTIISPDGITWQPFMHESGVTYEEYVLRTGIMMEQWGVSNKYRAAFIDRCLIYPDERGHPEWKSLVATEYNYVRGPYDAILRCLKTGTPSMPFKVHSDGNITYVMSGSCSDWMKAMRQIGVKMLTFGALLACAVIKPGIASVGAFVVAVYLEVDSALDWETGVTAGELNEICTKIQYYYDNPDELEKDLKEEGLETLDELLASTFKGEK